PGRHGALGQRPPAEGPLMSLALERTGTIDRLGARPRLLATLILLLGITALQGLPAQAPAPGLALLLVLAAAHRAGRPVSTLLEGLPARISFSGRLQDVDAAACRALLAAAEQSDAVMESLFGSKPVLIDRTDGLRATLAGGDILHVRPSGNAPELRCYSEAESAEKAERLCSACLSRIAALLSGKPRSTVSHPG
ncbi:hypothetical protein WDZ92_46770, partial [Nostoc sp. NIES-2111]